MISHHSTLLFLYSYIGIQYISLYVEIQYFSHFQGNQIIVHQKGSQQPVSLRGTGLWHAPESNLTQFTSAISAVHTGQDNSGQYSERCEDCFKNYTAEIRREGCAIHASRDCQHRRSGNPITSSAFKVTKQKITDMVEHEIKGARGLLPCDQRLVREYCIASNDKFKISIWVAFHLSTDLFLRRMEFRDIDGDSFQKDMCKMSDEFVMQAFVVETLKKVTHSTEETQSKCNCDMIYRFCIFFGTNIRKPIPRSSANWSSQEQEDALPSW